MSENLLLERNKTAQKWFGNKPHRHPCSKPTHSHREQLFNRIC